MNKEANLEKITMGMALRTLFWFLVLTLTCRYALIPELASNYPNVQFFRTQEFKATLFLLSLAISVRLFLFARKDDYEAYE